MNLAHVHLILNHLPVVGIPIALIFLGYGIFAKNQPMRRLALGVLVGLAILTIPVYLTGEPAEDVVEKIPGVAKSFIETHEDVAEYALVLTLMTGAAALGALWFQNDSKKSRLLNFIVMGLAGLAVLCLGYTANLGGQVRHSELRSGAPEVSSEGKAHGD